MGIPYGGSFSAVGAFWFLAVAALAEAVKPKYSGNFSAVGDFSFFGGNDFGGGDKPNRFRPPGR